MLIILWHMYEFSSHYIVDINGIYALGRNKYMAGAGIFPVIHVHLLLQHPYIRR